MNNHPSVYLGDAASISIGVGTLAGWLPAIAAILTIVWTVIRIYETDTVQRLVAKLLIGALKHTNTPVTVVETKGSETTSTATPTTVVIVPQQEEQANEGKLAERPKDDPGI